MHPILIKSPLITSYGALMLVALIAGWLLARLQARRVGVDPSHIDLLSPLLVLAGFAGAVIFGLLSDALGGSEALHGRGLYGGLIGAVLAGIIYAVAARIRLGDLGDAMAPAVALGIGVGRIGCFLAGCCWGTPCQADSPLGVCFPRGSFAFRQHVEQHLVMLAGAHSRPVHAVQLHEAAGAIALAGALLILIRRRKVAGETFLVMGLAYAALRFCIEFFRADNRPAIFGLTPSQAVCVGTAALAAATLVIRRLMADRWRLRVDKVQSQPSEAISRV